MQDALLGLIKHPPSWVMLIVVVILISHTLRAAFHLPRERGLIFILESFMTIILSVVVLHTIFGDPLFEQNKDSDSVLALILILSGFTILSGILYVFAKKLGLE
jgi:hypothetical protein